ncbi:MAG TPA: PAS domain-containing protein [Archangium sp.]|nr:PAS domain-containing protein [Archangium sp.]
MRQKNRRTPPTKTPAPGKRVPALDFQALFSLSPNPYMVLDRSLRYVAANEAYLHVTASRLENLLGRHVFDAFPNEPNDPGNLPARMLRESFERVLREGKPDTLALIPYQVPRHTPEGVVTEERYWSATHTPLFDEHGEVAFILQHKVDVTELQRLSKPRPPRGRCARATSTCAGWWKPRG